MYRISGDIFLGLIPCQYTLGVTAENIYNRICGSFVLQGIELDVNYYMGACSYPEHGKEAAELLEKVQSVARYAKTSVPQKNVVIYSKRLTEEVREEEKIAAMLRKSLRDGTLEMWYQPIMDPFKEEIHSAEMLLRLKNEQGNYFPPQRVVEVAERFSMMDDFGTGYSSILYLSSLALDTLKLDMKLVNQVNQGRQQMEFLKTVIQLAKIKHLVVVAEGVEDEKTLEKIKWCGADYIQGYYYSRPIPRTNFIEFITSYEN